MSRNFHRLILLIACSSQLFSTAIAEENSFELDTIVVSAPRKPRQLESVAASITLTEEDLRMKSGRSIGETLKDELGISNQSFGPGVGTPVIRGQSGSRVRVLNNGTGANDVSAISPDHASSVEPLLAERIEVLRGPASLLYGSGAIGGIVNVIDNRIPGKAFDKSLNSALEQRLDSASDETSTTMKLEGSKNQLAYHLDGSYRHRQNLDIGGSGIDTAKVAITDPELTVIDNPKGYLNNTGAEAISGSAGLSWIDNFGFAGTSINNLNNTYGIAPDGTGGELVKIAMRQTKYDFKSEWNNPFTYAQLLRTRLGYTDYQHTEIANGEPGAFFTNKSYEGRLELNHQDIGPVKGVIGLQAQSSDFNAIAKLSGASIVPRTDSYNYGVFALEGFDIGAVNYQFGTRVEQTDIHPDGFESLSYTPVSASISSIWKLDTKNAINLAITRSSRAPNMQELLANGYHDATRSFEKGSLSLTPETSYNLDLGYRFKSDWLRAEFDLFHNWASDYIYQARTGELLDEEGNSCSSTCKPVLQSAQQDAIFKGFESKLILPMLENQYGLLDITLFSDYTRGQFVNGGDVPRMPPLRYGLQLDYNQNKFSSYLRLTRGDEQTHSGAFETSTTGYYLLNFGLSYQLKTYQDSKLLLFARANNLLNENIRNATSYLRNFAPEAGRGGEIGFRLSY